MWVIFSFKYSFVFSAALDHRVAVTILRLGDGLDHSKLLDDEDQVPVNNDSTLTPATRHDFRTSISSNIMHADSNLSLTTVGLPDNNFNLSKFNFTNLTF